MVKALTLSKGHKPKNYDDSLKSDDNAELILGLCEGPIQGLEDGGHSLFLNDETLWSATGEDNFESYNIRITEGDGTQDERIKYKLGGISKAFYTQGRELIEQNEFYIAETTTANIDYIDVRIAIQQLMQTNDKGDSVYATGKFRIEYKKKSMPDTDWIKYGAVDIRPASKSDRKVGAPIDSNGNVNWADPEYQASYKNRVKQAIIRSQTTQDIAITGKTTSGYFRDFRLVVDRDPNIGETYLVKVTRLSPPSTTFSTFVRDGYLTRATVTRYLVLYDDFVNNRNVYQKRTWTIWRVTSLNKQYIGLELRNPMDGVNFNVPARRYLPPEFPFVEV